MYQKQALIFALALNYKFGKRKPLTTKNKPVSEDEYNRVKVGK